MAYSIGKVLDRTSVVGTLIGVVALVVAFPPWNLWPLLWIALVPWLWVLARCQTRQQAWAISLLYSFLVSLGGFYWIVHSLRLYGEIHWLLCLGILFLFCLFCQPQLTLWGWVFWKSSRQTEQPLERRSSITIQLLAFFCLACLYAAFDHFLPKLFRDTLGHATYQMQRIRQWADLGGPLLISVWVVWFNLLHWKIAEAAVQWRKNRDAAAIKNWSAVALTSWLLCFGYGHFRKAQIDRWLAQSQHALSVAVIQSNIGDIGKMAAESGVKGATQEVVDTYLMLSKQAVQTPGVDVVVWPETAYPTVFERPNAYSDYDRDQGLKRFVKEHQMPLVFGGYDEEGEKDFNSVFFLASPGKITGDPTVSKRSVTVESPTELLDLLVYHKNKLLLFGETIPGADWIPWIKEQFPQVGYFGQGPGPQIFSIAGKQGGVVSKVGPVICYEILFPDYVLGVAKAGADWILNLTNDSWFGPWGEPYHHLAMTVFRSIETRLPQLRATNTGISALVLPSGEMVQKSGLFTQEIFKVQIPVAEQKLQSPMLRFGYWTPEWTAVVSLLGGLVWLWRRRRQVIKS